MYFYNNQLLSSTFLRLFIKSNKFIIITQDMRNCREHIHVKQPKDNTQFFFVGLNCGIRFQKYETGKDF